MIDYMIASGDRSYLDVIDNTFVRAPHAFPVDQTAAEIDLVESVFLGPFGGFFEQSPFIYYTNFLNGYYDDEGWWALAWIRAFDLTNQYRYLAQAWTIFTDMTGGWDSARGGLYWSKSHKGPSGQQPYQNAIANELFLAVAAALSLRFSRLIQAHPDAELTQLQQAAQTTKDWASAEWYWFSTSGLIQPDRLISDSLNPSSRNDGTTPVWTYNQGVVLGGLCDLSEVIQDRSLLTDAKRLASAMLDNVVSTAPAEAGMDRNGVLTEYVDLATSEAIDNAQFKGICIRGLAKLFSKTRQPRLASYIRRNAVWATRTRNTASQHGRQWDKRVDTADFVRQTSALDLLTAAITVARRPGQPSALADPMTG